MKDEIIKVIKENSLDNWFEKCPWMFGYIGNIEPNLIWFLCERPSLHQYDKALKLKPLPTENVEWNVSQGDKLFREAIHKSGLKTGNRDDNEGFSCYISNLIMEPIKEVDDWKKQADMWRPFLQEQIKKRTPKVIVTVGRKADKIFKHMVSLGLEAPKSTNICQYVYITNKPESGGKKRCPNHPDRRREFIASICEIAKFYT